MCSLLLCLLLLTGCSKDKVNNIEKFKEYNTKKESYQLTGTMSIISNEDEFVYNLQVDVKDNKYYKVSLINTISNHEQIILKNDDGVYV